MLTKIYDATWSNLISNVDLPTFSDETGRYYLWLLHIHNYGPEMRAKKVDSI